MFTEIVRLENVPSVMKPEEIPRKVLVTSPRERSYEIPPQYSGYYDNQVFTSESLPDEILYELLCIVKYPDGSLYPKYRANVVTKTELCLNGKAGYENCINMIHGIAWWLTWQEKMLEAKSIESSDLKFFDYKKEKLSYWLASPCSYAHGVYTRFGPGSVENGVYCKFRDIDLIIKRGDYWITKKTLAVRPVMILTSKVIVDLT